MKFPLAYILLISFVGVALFGYTGMHTGMQNHEGGCIAALARGTDCPKQGNLVDYLAFHLDAFKNFSTATFNDIASSLLILSLFVALVTLWALRRRNLAPPKLAYFRLKQFNSFHPPSQDELIGWLSLHENSPALF
jgi:hypothetical protein